MSDQITIRVPSSRPFRRHLALDYHDTPIRLAQARLTGRRVLTPALDLSSYTCRAVLDWTTIEVELARSTQLQHIRRVIEDATGQSVWVKPLTSNPGGVDTRFALTLQEPTLREICDYKVLLENAFGLVSDPTMAGLEVSVDFYPRKPDDAARSRLVAVLSRHLAPKRDVLNYHLDNPRFAWGTGPTKTSRAWMAPSTAATGDFLRDVHGDQMIPYDATFYLGAKFSALSWRVMDKVLDRQNKKTGTARHLPDNEKRARVEVTLSQSELAKRGIRSIDDLLRHDWLTMQGDYFGFYLPTFNARETSSIADRYWEPHRLTRFLNAGLVGLDAMDRQQARDRKSIRADVRKHFLGTSKRLPPLPRNGRGSAGTTIAYAELNERIRTALGNMQEREHRLVRGK